jgi:hypothetical protein
LNLFSFEHFRKKKNGPRWELLAARSSSSWLDVPAGKL